LIFSLQNFTDYSERLLLNQAGLTELDDWIAYSFLKVVIC